MQPYRIYFDGLPIVTAKIVIADDFEKAFSIAKPYASEKGVKVDSIVKMDDEFINLPQIGQVPQKPE